MQRKICYSTCALIALSLMHQVASAQQPATTDPLANVDKSPAQAMGVYVFGKKNQSAATQQADEKACFAGAKTASGYDQAMADAAAPAAAQPQPSGGAARGAVRGAVVGTAIGAVAGDAGKGAAIGATTGVVAGGVGQKQARTAQANAAASAQEQKKANALAELKKAFGACMEARDYSVK
jgi:hypothetical protein